MSDIPTPITDRDCLWGYEVSEFNEYVDSDTCRDFERQIAAKTEEIERLSNALRDAQQGAEDARRGIRHLERQLDEARWANDDARSQLRIADEQIALERGALTHVRNVLSRILADHGGGLDPAVEREARDIVNS